MSVNLENSRKFLNVVQGVTDQLKIAWKFEIKAKCQNGVLSEEKLDETAIATTFSCYGVLKPFRNHTKLQTSSLNKCFNNIGVFILFRKSLSFFTFQKSKSRDQLLEIKHHCTRDMNVPFVHNDFRNRIQQCVKTFIVLLTILILAGKTWEQIQIFKI